VDGAGTAYELGKLPLTLGIPTNVGATAASGSGSEIARNDHRHGRDAQTGTNTTAIAANATAIAAARGAIPAPSMATPKVEGTGAAGASAAYARGDHVHPSGSGFVEMLSGQWTLSNNNVDYEVSNAALHNFLKAANAPKLMHFVFRYTAGGVNYAYLLNCPGADTPLGNAESRTFACFGWRERTSQGIAGEIVVSPSSYRIKVTNIDARGNARVNFKLWGLR